MRKKIYETIINNSVISIKIESFISSQESCILCTENKDGFFITSNGLIYCYNCASNKAQWATWILPGIQTILKHYDRYQKLEELYHE